MLVKIISQDLIKNLAVTYIRSKGYDSEFDIVKDSKKRSDLMNFNEFLRKG